MSSKSKADTKTDAKADKSDKSDAKADKSDTKSDSKDTKTDKSDKVDKPNVKDSGKKSKDKKPVDSDDEGGKDKKPADSDDEGDKKKKKKKKADSDSDEESEKGKKKKKGKEKKVLKEREPEKDVLCAPALIEFLKKKETLDEDALFAKVAATAEKLFNDRKDQGEQYISTVMSTLQKTVADSSKNLLDVKVTSSKGKCQHFDADAVNCTDKCAATLEGLPQPTTCLKHMPEADRIKYKIEQKMVPIRKKANEVGSDEKKKERFVEACKKRKVTMCKPESDDEEEDSKKKGKGKKASDSDAESDKSDGEKSDDD